MSRISQKMSFISSFQHHINFPPKISWTRDNDRICLVYVPLFFLLFFLPIFLGLSLSLPQSQYFFLSFFLSFFPLQSHHLYTDVYNLSMFIFTYDGIYMHATLLSRFSLLSLSLFFFFIFQRRFLLRGQCLCYLEGKVRVDVKHFY